MSSVEPTSDVWEHGLLPLPGAKLSEASLLALLELQHRLPADLSVGLEQWAALAGEGLRVLLITMFLFWEQLFSQHCGFLGSSPPA